MTKRLRKARAAGLAVAAILAIALSGCSNPSPTSESPCRRAWSTKVKGSSFASVTSHSDRRARLTARGFLSTP